MSTLPFGAPQSRDFALALEIADRERESGRSDAACGMFRVVMAQCPDYAEGWLTFPDVQDKQPVPADFTAMVRVADREQQAARFEEAVALYRVVLAQAPAYVDGQAKLARALFCLRRWDEAWRAFDIRFRLMDGPPTVNARDAEKRK